MAVISGDDRWTCPRCNRTTVVDGTEADRRCALDAVRKRHDKGHNGCPPEHGSEVIEALGLPDPLPRPRRRRNLAHGAPS